MRENVNIETVLVSSFQKYLEIDSLFASGNFWTPSRRRWGFFAILIIGALVRFPGLFFYNAVTADQGRYLVLARNLLAGNFRWSADFPLVPPDGGFSTFIPPLYAWLSALGAIISGNVALSATLVSFFSGIFALYLTMRVIEKLHSLPVALLTGFFLALHPYFIHSSTSCYTEMLFVAVFSAALFFYLRAFGAPNKKRLWLICGLLFGLLALTRNEGIIFAATFALLTAAQWKSVKPLWILPGLIIVILPYSLFRIVSASPGSSYSNLSWNLAIGKGWERDIFKVDKNGRLVYLEKGGKSPGEILFQQRRQIPRYYIRELRDFGPRLVNEVFFRWMIPFALLGMMAAFGFSSKPFRYRVLIFIMLLPNFYLPLSHYERRYYYVSILIYTFFTIIGMGILTRCIVGIIRKFTPASRKVIVLSNIAIYILLGIFCYRQVLPEWGFAKQDDAGRLCAWMRLKTFGEYIRDLPQRPAFVSARESGFSYYTHTRQAADPLGPPDSVLRFLHRNNVGYILIDTASRRQMRPEQMCQTDPRRMLPSYKLVLKDPENFFLLYRVLSPEEEKKNVSSPPVVRAERRYMNLLKKQKPRNISACVQGLIAQRNGETAKALELYRKVPPFPGFSLYKMALQRRYFIRLYAGSLPEKPRLAYFLGFVDSTFPYRALYRAKAAESRGDFSKARKNYESALKRFPENTTVLEHYATFAQRSQSNLLAGKLLIRWIALDRKNLTPYFNLGELYLRERRFKDLKVFCRRAIQRFPSSPEMQLKLIKGYLAQRLYARAVIEAEDICERFPKNPWAVYFSARALEGEGKQSQAISLYERLLGMNPPKYLIRQARMALKEHAAHLNKKKDVPKKQ